jgi:hypothetical protein
MTAPIVETDSFEFIRHYVLYEKCLGFQIPIGLEQNSERPFITKEISSKDIPVGNLFLGQLKGRTLPVASARFALRIAAILEERFEV